MIILEGPDGSGKTSLAKRIRKETDRYTLFLQTNGPPNINALADIIGWLAAIPPSLPIVCDRFAVISEAVYGPILRDKCIHGLSAEQMARWLKARPATVIYCRPHYETLLAELNKEEQKEGVIEQYRDIVLAYDYLMADLKRYEVNVIYYDWNQGSLKSILKEIQS